MWVYNQHKKESCHYAQPWLRGSGLEPEISSLWGWWVTNFSTPQYTRGECFSGRSPHDRTWKEMKTAFAVGASNWIRTSDLPGMNRTLYHWAKEAYAADRVVGTTRFLSGPPHLLWQPRRDSNPRSIEWQSIENSNFSTRLYMRWRNSIDRNLFT